MDKVLRGQEEFTLPYLDDTAVLSVSWPKHMEHLRAVLTRLREAGLTVKAPKCQLARAAVTYFRHVIGQGHRRHSEMKVVAIQGFPQPQTKTDIRAFPGIASYYRTRTSLGTPTLPAPLLTCCAKMSPNRLTRDEKKENACRVFKAAQSNQPVPLISSVPYMIHNI